ncbi:MAG: hypothetical protein AAF533_21450 [Acidobacteriota bacterium]
MVRSLSLLTLIALLLAGPAHGQDVLTPEQEAAKRLGFYFALSLERASPLGQSNGLGVIIDEPDPGRPLSVVGRETDGDFGGRFDFGFQLGFRLRGKKGRVQGSFYQYDQRQSLLNQPGNGQRIANVLASPDAGFFEDIGCAVCPFLNTGVPDGLVRGIEVAMNGDPDFDQNVLDGAEDWNFNGSPDFIRFDNSDALVGVLETDFQIIDLEYVRQLKRLEKLSLDWRAGIRIASVSQLTDVGYRNFGSFAVYSDNEGPTGASALEETRPCGAFNNSGVQDGDGDGEASSSQNEPDGDGFLDGDCDGLMSDSISSVPTLTEDRILANIDARGAGLRVGLDGRFDLTKKWRLAAGVSLSMLDTKVDYRYTETFTSERDRFLNFIDWDFNGDGVYDNFDLDFNGDCLPDRPEFCFPTVADEAVLPTVMVAGRERGFVTIRSRVGARDSVISSTGPARRAPNGVNDNAFMAPDQLRVGDPVPESERNRDTLTTTTLLNDLAGSDSGWSPMLDLNLGMEYQFSRFASLDFGLRASRWWGAGRFRELANSVVSRSDVDIMDGDFTMDGYYIRLTVVPR